MFFKVQRLGSRNGFVHTVLECYSKHRALVLHPDDVWFAIMVQFCCLVNGCAEELQSLFVLHDGKQEVVVQVECDPRVPLDMDSLVRMCVVMLSLAAQDKIVDPELHSWMLPAFSTTTRTDLISSASIMLGTVKEYFLFCIMLLCGIPRQSFSRAEKLKEFGSDAVAWHHLLCPVLSRFTCAFNEPHHPDNLEQLGSGPTWLSGWITAFTMFDKKGKWMGNANERGGRVLVLDGAVYPLLNSKAISARYTQVDIKLEVQEVLPTTLIAGSISTWIQSSGDKTLSKTGEWDTASPAITWWWSLKAEHSEQPDVASPAVWDDDPALTIVSGSEGLNP
ncbi:hypothetical protein EDC04DRAFT_2868962 [Pisolithus marmoratus]|nr:hypothetical protein EDC04DRAFT_2868962 [Pisolithus marmoratus]